MPGTYVHQKLTFIVLSSDDVNNVCPSLEKSTLLTVAVWALKTVDSPFLKHKKNLILDQPLKYLCFLILTI